MPTVDLILPHHRYTVHIAPGSLQKLGAYTKEVAAHGRCALVSDANVTPLHAPAATSALASAGFKVTSASVPGGEAHKNLDTVRVIYDAMLTAKLERKSPLVALGGGVLGDTAGFVAATYLRGVPFVQVPTTLLAMVDSSIGGKVGVNVPQGKNLIGAFYQPHVVVIDPAVLTTLPLRELRCGLAECVKHGVIRSAENFAWLHQHVAAILQLDMDALTELVRWNVQTKATVVMADEKEQGERAHLNFGHTFAHAIEATAGYGRIEHGEAVSLGMVAATRLAVDMGMCPADVGAALGELLQTIGLPVREALPDTDTLMTAMTLDKKVADGKLRLVLPQRMGAVTIRQDVPAAAVRSAWESIRR